MRLMLWIGLALLVLVAGAVWWAWTPDRPRAELEAKYLRGPQDYLTVEGLRLHVRDDGPKAAPAIVLIHGFGATLHTWEPWAADLSRDFRVVRFDLPGHGFSDPAPDGNYRVVPTVRLLTALMDALGIRQATLVGNSLGGEIAWRTAVEAPERVDRLVLIAPSGFLSPGQEYGEPLKLPGWFSIVEHVLPRTLIAQSLKSYYGEPSRLTAETIDRYWDMLRVPGVRTALVGRMGQFIVEDPHPLLPRIRVPTLLMWGERDIVIPHSGAPAFVGLIPDVRQISYADVGHMPMEEVPERSLRDLRAFLNLGR